MAQFKGLFTALITPFNDTGVDEKAFQDLVVWQADQGVQGVVPVGTTGESPTLSHDEHKRVVELAVEAAAGRILVMAGAGSNSTDEAIGLVKHAKQAGADGVLIVAPYYNKPTQQGLYEHYSAIQAAADLPNFIYNIPGRSVVNITDETLAALAKLPNIAGVKDATGDLARVSTLRQLVDDEFILLSGEDMTTVGFNAMGGSGCISVTSNVAPAACTHVQRLCLEGKYPEALAAHEKLVALHTAMFAETSPIPVKYAMHLLGKGDGRVRLPLTPPDDATKRVVQDAMQGLGLL